MSQDTKTALKVGETLPNEDLWRQIIEDVQPSLVLTTGTAGGIGPDCEVGDVVVSPIGTVDCQKWLKSEPFYDPSFKAPPPNGKRFKQAQSLFQSNAAQLPKDNSRPPKILKTDGVSTAVLATDSFDFDTSNDHYKLQGLGSVLEMRDAILGIVMSKLGATAPYGLAVRNVSDPQIKAERPH